MKLANANWLLLNHLLGIQQAKDSPEILECLGDRWTGWSEMFTRTGITTCPTWQKTEVIGNLTKDGLAQLGKLQPKVPSEPETCAKLESPAQRRTCTTDAINQEIKNDPGLIKEQYFARIVLPPKTSATYTVSVPAGVACSDPAICAAQCAAAFPGFVLAASGTRVDGDATYWLSDSDPGSYPGIKHPMAQYYGPPGELYGHVNRKGEACYRWDEANERVFLTTLYEVVLSPTVSVSHCGDF